MTTRRQHIVDRLKSSIPGPTADQVARELGMSLGAVMNHIKHIRKAHTVISTPHKHDARIKHYRIRTVKAKAPAAEDPAQAKQQPKASVQKPTLSATELEAAICNTLRDHAGPRRPMSMQALCDHVQAPPALVRPAMIALVQREAVVRIKSGYHLPDAVQIITQMTVAAPRVVEVMAGTYTGEELRPFDGRPGAMDAYALPSRGATAC